MPKLLLSDYQLDKKTFINLRWIALFGQLTSVLVVRFILDFNFSSFTQCWIIIIFGILTNLYLWLIIKENQLSNYLSTLYLAYDIIQLGCLLYLTGGIANPFVFLLVIPAVFSSKYLNLISSLILVTLTGIILLLISLFYIEIPHPEELHFHVPDYYLYSIPISVFIGLIFLVYFGIKFGSEYRIRKDALDKMQTILAKEHELVSLGGQAAASAHSLGTPLSTISLIAKELKEEIGKDERFSDDIDLLISQSERCNQILKKLSLNPDIEDEFFENDVSFNEYIIEIVRSFEETSENKFKINTVNDNNKIRIRRSIEIIFGLRNFIGNANKFANQYIDINIKSDKTRSEILIKDDGDGFPLDIINRLGEPYLKSFSKKNKSKMGMGLGTFIGKTLLEKNFATITFKNLKNNEGAIVKIEWDNSDLNKI